MLNKEKLLVTGAGGFIGGWLVETLYLINKIEVRAGIHQWSNAARLARFPSKDIQICDIMDAQNVSKALDDITSVVHCAKGSDLSILEGTRNLLEASLQKGVKRFVYLSTAEVYGNQTGIINETRSTLKTGNTYGDTKIEAEKLCWDYNAKGLPVTIVRPSIVYGPYSKTWSVSIAQKLQSGNWGLFDKNGDGICNLIYISDLVAAVLGIMQNERAVGEAFNLNGPDVLTWNDYFRKFNDALGLPVLKEVDQQRANLQANLAEPVRNLAKYAKDHFEMPIRKVAAKSRLAKIVLKMVEKKLKTSPRITDFSLFNRDANYQSTKSHELFGFSPKYDIDTGLKLTVAWLKQLGLAQ